MNARHTAIVLAALGALALFAVTLSAAGGITDAGAPTADNDSLVAQPVVPSDGSADGAPTRAPSSGLSGVDGTLDETGDATSGTTTDETGDATTGVGTVTSTDATTDETERGEFGIGSERQGAIDEALEGAEGEVQVVVRLEDADPGALAASSTPRATLQSHATGTQRAVEAFAQSRDGVTIERQFWVTNAMLVTVDTDEVGLEALAGIADVTAVHDNFEVQTLDAAATSEPVTGTAARGGAATGAAATGSAAADENETAADATGENATAADATGEDVTAADAEISDGPSAASHGSATDGLEMVRAPETWTDFETQGEGVRVAVLDSGANRSHPDVDVDGWAEFAVDGSVVSEGPANAYDSGEHGTHVAGTVVGGDASGEHIGVAPAAEHYHGLVLPGGTGTYTQVLAGMEWAIDQDADVLSMSLGAEGYSGEYADPIRNARQAGVLPVVAVGNDGQGSSSSPGNVYGAVAVGSVDDTESVASSSGGETIDTDVAFGDDAYDDWPDQYVVPDLTAPGVGVKSAVPGGGYQLFGGTSMATPHVAGTAALVMSYGDGNLTVDEVEQVLLESATPPTAGHTKDDRHGVGIVDAYDATQTLADRDTRVTGRVVDASDAGVANATITTDHVGQATTNGTGHYELNVTSDVHNVTADRLGFEPVTEEIDATGVDALERNLTLSTEVTEVEPIAFQPAYANTSETVAVTYRAANVDSYDVTFDDSVSLADPSATALSVDGDGTVGYGDTIDYSGETGPFEIDVTVSPDAGHVGQVGLNHTFAGTSETVEDRSGPTTVHDDVVALPGDVPGFDPTDANDSIHSVASFVAPGTTIELANETFVEGMNAQIQPGIQTAIYLPSPVTVTAADGADPVVAVYNDTPATEAYGVVAGGSDVEVSNLSFVGSSGVDALLETVGDDTVYADNVLVDATTGVSVSGGQGAVVRNNTIDGTYYGVNVETADDAAVVLDVEDVQDAVVEENHVGAGNYGAFGVRVSANNAPTDVDRIHNNTVYVQQLDEFGANGIDVYRHQATVDTVSGNDVTLLDSGSTGRGIHLFSLAHVTNITDNDVTVDSGGMRGIAINVSSSVETIDGNDVNLTAWGTRGVRIDDSTVTTVSNTSVVGPSTAVGTAGIVVLDSPGVTVEHNDVTDATFAVSTDSDDLTVADNEIARPSIGIDTSGDANAITGNDISQATSFGIRSYTAATGLQVLSNDVGVATQGLAGHETGIYVNDTVVSAVIEGNDVTGGAIGIRDEASTSLRYNAVEGANDTGILTTSDGTTVADVVVNDTDTGVHVAGADGVRVDDTVVAESDVSVELESAAGAEVADVELYGTAGADQGVLLTDAPNATLTNVTVGAFPIGVSAGTSSNLTVRNANVTGTGYGVFLAGVSDATLEDLTFDAVGHALQFDAGSEANASEMTLEDVDAVAVFDGASEGVVSDATVANASNTDATVQFGDVDPSLVAVENVTLADGTTVNASGRNASVALGSDPATGLDGHRSLDPFFELGSNGDASLLDLDVQYAPADFDGVRNDTTALYGHDGGSWLQRGTSTLDGSTLRVTGADVPSTYTAGVFAEETALTDCAVLDVPGTYTLGESLSHTGEGSCLTVTADDVSIDGLDRTVAGDRNGTAVTVDGAANVTVENVTATEQERGVVATGSSEDVTVRDVTVNGTESDGILSEDTDRLVVENSTVTRAAQHAAWDNASVAVSGGSDVLIANSTVTESDDAGVWFGGVGAPAVENATVANVTVDGASTGVALHAPNATVGESTINATGNPGIDVRGEGATIVDTEIGATAAGAPTTGINVDEGSVDSIAGNDLTVVDVGVDFGFGDGTADEIARNTVRVQSGGHAGIQIGETAHVRAVEDNEISGGTNGILAASVDSVADNAVNETDDRAIQVGSDDAVVERNAIHDAERGLVVVDAENVTADATTVAAVDWHGVAVQDSVDVALTDVEVDGSGYDNGSVLLDNVTDVSVGDATLADDGIAVRSGTDVEVTGATVTDAPNGVQIDDGGDGPSSNVTVRAPAFETVVTAVDVDDGATATVDGATYDDVAVVAAFDGSSEATVADAVVANASNTDATVQFRDVDASAVGVENLTLADGTTIAAAGENATVELAESPPGGAPADREAVGAYLATNGVGAEPLVDVEVDYAASDVAGRNASSLRLFRHDGSDWVDVPDSGVDTGERVVVANVTASGTVGAFVNEPGAIEGTVTDEGTDAAIEGATVTVVDDAAVANATTDASGTYSVAVPDGALDVTVAADGYASNASSVGVGANETVAHDVGLAGNATIAGTVTDVENGAGVDGATVTADDGAATYEATTNGTGVYEIAVPGAGATYDVGVAADGYATNDTAHASLQLADGATTTADVVLAGNATLSGTVTEAVNDVPVENATVTARTGSTTYRVETGQSGTYSLTLPGGGATYDVGADADGFLHHDLAHEDLALADGADETADVELTGNASIGGVVVDETTQGGVENATVTAEAAGLTFAATTDASGEYTVRNVTGLDEEYDVTATHSDYVAGENATTVGDGADVEGVDVELAPSGNATVTGTVTDERADVPIQGADVELVREDGNLTAGPTATNATGDYRFDDVVGDWNYTAVVAADGYETGSAEANVSADAATRIDATVAGNASIAGTAVDANAIDAPGVENATVTVAYPDAGSFSVDDATDSNGAFAIDDVPGTGGSYDVTTTADGYEPNGTSATVGDGAAVALGDVALLGNATVSGAVVEVRNEVGVENATVTVANGSTSYENATDASGTYAVRVRGGAAYDVGADATGYAANDTAHADLAVANGSTETADVELTGNASIAGTVTDETTGAPIENANVTATVGGLSFEATTDASGSYVIADVVGTGESYAVAANHSDYLEDATTATVGDGAAVQAADVELAPDGNATVAGTVTDERAGVPVENASVQLEREDGNLTVGPTGTDATGAYQIEDVVGDWNYTAVVTADGYETGSAEANVSADATTTIDATVAGNASIAGTAVDANAIGAPGVENATVTVEYPGAGSFSVANASDPDGAFAIDDVPGTGGSYDVTTTADGYEPNGTSATVGDGAAVALGDVALVGNATVDGAVTDVLADATVESATVTVANGSLSYENATDASGTYAVRVRGGATYDVGADATGYVENASAHAGLPVADQATETVDVGLTGNAEIAGAVADAVTGAGVENATVVATAAGRSYANDTGANGSYAVAVAGTGASYDLAVTATGYEEGTASGVTVGDGASVASNVSVAGNASITGDVVDANDTTTELEDVSVAAVVGDESYPQTNVTNGTYEIDDVPGTGDAYTVNATARAFEWNATTVTVATDATGVDVLLDRRDRYVGLDDVSVSGPVDEGETFTVEATVRNLGARNWTSNATYLVDGTAVETTELDPNASANDTVAFTDSIDDAGTYALVVETANETAGTNLTVESTGGGVIAPPPTPEASIFALDLDRTSVAVGQSVAVDVTLQNGAYRDASTALELTVDGDAVATTTADVPARSSATTTLSTTFDVTGTYDLAVNGQDAGTVEVTGDSDADGDGDSDADGDGDSDPDGDSDADGDGDLDADSDGDTDADADGDSDGDDSDDGSPGFGLFAGLVAVLVATAAVALRGER